MVACHSNYVVTASTQRKEVHYHRVNCASRLKSKSIDNCFFPFLCWHFSEEGSKVDSKDDLYLCVNVPNTTKA